MSQNKSINPYTWKHPEKKKKIATPSTSLAFLCQCKQGHVFDYKKRDKYPDDCQGFAPCQGKCPYCGCGEFSFMDTSKPINFNFVR